MGSHPEGPRHGEAGKGLRISSIRSPPLPSVAVQSYETFQVSFGTQRELVEVGDGQSKRGFCHVRMAGAGAEGFFSDQSSSVLLGQGHTAEAKACYRICQRGALEHVFFHLAEN